MKPLALIPGKVLSTLLALALLTGCASGRASTGGEFPEEGLRTEIRAVGVQDKFGRPVFGPILAQTPTRPGEMYVIVGKDREDVPRVSYLVAVVGEGSDAARPFNVFFDWTGKGFKAAGEFVSEVFSGSEPSGRDEAEFVMAFAAVGATVVIAGGIIIGVADGTWEAGKEIGKAFSDKEVVASFTTYEYDDMGRISSSRAWFPGSPPMEIIRTTFSYDPGMLTPSGAVVRNIPDNVQYTLDFK